MSLFSRMRQSIRDRDWGMVGIDFAVVAAGVWLGVAIGNWIEAAQERRLERDYLERIRADLSASADLSGARAGVYADDAVIYEDMMVELERCTLDGEAAEDRFATALYRTGKFSRPPLYGGTLEEMSASGQMRLIRDPALRGTLVELMDTVRDFDAIYQQINARAQSYTTYIEQRMRMRAANDLRTGVDAKTRAFDADLVDFDFDALCADPLYLGAASGLRHSIGFLEVIARGHEERYRAAVDTLDAALAELASKRFEVR